MSLADRLRAMLDSPDAEIEASATPTEVPVTQPAAQPTAVPVQASQNDEVARLRADLAARDQDNARLRLHSFGVEARAWFAQVVGEMRAFPAEEATLIAQYIQAASDDHQYGMGLEGQSRVAVLKTAMATRTSVKHLTAEALAPTTLAAIMNSAKPAADPSAPMTQERRAQLHGFSNIGQQVIAEEKNGSAKH